MESRILPGGDAAVIIRHLAGGRALVDREALAGETGLSEVTIRAHLRAACYDPRTRRALYDHDTARAALAPVVPWPLMQGRKYKTG
jgi:hypothetical protein